MNKDQERARIDRGAEGDKIAGFDPAAAPLGTDEEAAGTEPVAGGRPGFRAPPRVPGQTVAPDDSIAPDASTSKPFGLWWAVALIVAGLAVIAVMLVRA